MNQTLEAATRQAMAAKKRNKTAGHSGSAVAAPVRAIPAYQPFPIDMLPLVLRNYVDAAAASIVCDPALVALPALATAMSCIGNSRAIQLRRGWSEPAVLWAITVARSGSAKSPGFSAAVDPLNEYQMDRWDAHQHEKAAAKKSEEQALPAPPCLVTSDATIEAVGELLRDNPRGLLLARDELDGWFQSFTKHRRGDSSDRPAWLELHRARTLRLDRITRDRGPLAVRRACCSLCGTIQPAVLARALTAEAIVAGLGRGSFWPCRRCGSEYGPRHRFPRSCESSTGPAPVPAGSPPGRPDQTQAALLGAVLRGQGRLGELVQPLGRAAVQRQR